MSNNTALVIGCTGLVGRELVNVFLDTTYYSTIKLVTRRSLNLNNDRIEEIILEDFDQMEGIKDQLNANDYFCCLGTTMKIAGSKENFKKVDLDYPLQLAKIASQSSGFRQYLVVTSAGAGSGSPLFYNQVKGELEDELRRMKLSGLMIFRPSLLIGDRKEFRLGEEIAKGLSAVLSFFMVGLKRRLWSIKASDVAKSMFMIARDQRKGTRVWNSNDMMDRIKSPGF
ncbi:oxidoreductase [Marinoscillum sp.]|uniref:oxidoreductase n=1 Tax=Marinoscillum sp. TaxID=2024838 RepID=UPI003BA9A8FD